MKKMITLKEPAYRNGGTLRIGICSIDEWFEATGEDDSGKEVRVIWTEEAEYPGKGDSEEFACNWASPFAVLDQYGNLVDDGEGVEIDY